MREPLAAATIKTFEGKKSDYNKFYKEKINCIPFRFSILQKISANNTLLYGTAPSFLTIPLTAFSLLSFALFYFSLQKKKSHDWN